MNPGSDQVETGAGEEIQVEERLRDGERANGPIAGEKRAAEHAADDKGKDTDEEPPEKRAKTEVYAEGNGDADAEGEEEEEAEDDHPAKHQSQTGRHTFAVVLLVFEPN